MEAVMYTPTADKAKMMIVHLHFRRGQRTIFDGIDLDIPRGRITAILGPSGTGKTTLLRLIGAQLAPRRGRSKSTGRTSTACRCGRLRDAQARRACCSRAAPC